MESGTSQEAVSERQPPLQLGISGLGGWLVLIQIGIYSTIVLQLTQLFRDALPAIERDNWNALTSRDSEYYDALWGPTIVFELVYTLVSLLFCGYILLQFYRKKAMLPRLMIIFYSLSLAVTVIDSVLVDQIPMVRHDGIFSKEVLRSLFTCAIWIPYFIRSERVRNTFVR